MNTKCFLKVLILGAFFIQACKEDRKIFQPTETTIEGKILGGIGLNLVLKDHSHISATVDNQSSFVLKGQLKTAGFYTILSENRPLTTLFLVPGDKIQMTTDVNNQSGNIQFEGDHAVENNYLINYNLLKMQLPDKDYPVFFSQSEEAFITAIEERNLKIIADQQEYQKKNGVFDQLFAEMLTEELSFEATNLKLNYPSYFTFFNPDSQLVLSETYDSFLQNLDIDNENHLSIPAFEIFLPTFLEFKTKFDSTEQYSSPTIKKFELVSKLFNSKKIKEVLYHQVMEEALNNNIDDAAILIKNYGNVQSHAPYLNEAMVKFESWKPLLKGKKAPTWSYVSNLGKKVGLDDLNGKVVYVDIWATWCGPCLRELPYLEKLQNHFKKNNDLVFVSISIDAQKNMWSAMVKEKNMKGIQLIADQDWNSSIIRDYMITGIPRFILIGKEGQILNANAPRPSDKTLLPLIESVLN